MGRERSRRTLTMPTAICALSMFALVVIGCAPSSTGRSSQQEAPKAAAPLQAVLVSTQLTPGRQRVAIGVLDRNTPVNDARVRARAYRGSPTDPMASEADALFKGEGLLGNGVYVAYLTFGAAGAWVLEIAAARGQDQAGITQVPIKVLAASTTPATGQPAPVSRNLTRADVPDVSYIDSGVPPNDMHEISIADAIAQRRPALIVFATPAFCTSAMCGPEVHAVQQLEPAYRDRVAFIHVEIYQNFKADPSKRTFSPAVLEWRLQTEPWVFLVDASGIVRYAFEGPSATDELVAALDAMLGAR